MLKIGIKNFKITFVFLAVILSSCGSTDSGESSACQRSLSIQGSVSQVDVNSSEYDMQSVWFNSSVEEIVLTELDERMMEDLGLDIMANEDIERYAYWLSAYDFRTLLIETTENELTLDSSNGASLQLDHITADGKDLSVYFFELKENDVQPDTDVEVFDISEIQDLRDSPEELGRAVRRLIDEMRTNNQADAIVAFTPDRSADSALENIFINLFSPSSSFASSGGARFTQLKAIDGEVIPVLDYPVEGVDAISTQYEVKFAEDEVQVQADCFKLRISG